MKLIVLALAALLAVALAAPAEAPGKEVKIIRSEFDQQPEGGFAWGYESEDGIKQEAAGEVKSVVDEENKPQQVVVIRGSYSYPDPEGKPHTFTYFADENGFHVEGEDVPKA